MRRRQGCWRRNDSCGNEERWLSAAARGLFVLQRRRPQPAAEAGRSCWGSGQRDASGREADAGSRNLALSNGVRLRGCTKTEPFLCREVRLVASFPVSFCRSLWYTGDAARPAQSTKDGRRGVSPYGVYFYICTVRRSECSVLLHLQVA